MQDLLTFCEAHQGIIGITGIGLTLASIALKLALWRRRPCTPAKCEPCDLAAAVTVKAVDEKAFEKAVVRWQAADARGDLCSCKPEIDAALASVVNERKLAAGLYLVKYGPWKIPLAIKKGGDGLEVNGIDETTIMVKNDTDDTFQAGDAVYLDDESAGGIKVLKAGDAGEGQLVGVVDSMHAPADGPATAELKIYPSPQVTGSRCIAIGHDSGHNSAFGYKALAAPSPPEPDTLEGL